MPTYDYNCARCGTVEIFQSMRDDPLKQCPNCGSKRFKREISGGAGVIFKGSGFWETDYNRGTDYQKAAKAEGGGDAPAGGQGAGKDAEGGSSASGQGSQSGGTDAGSSGGSPGKAEQGGKRKGGKPADSS